MAIETEGPAYEGPKCEAHGYDCPTDPDGRVCLHSHSSKEPLVWYCEASCTIGACAERMN